MKYSRGYKSTDARNRLLCPEVTSWSISPCQDHFFNIKIKSTYHLFCGNYNFLEKPDKYALYFEYVLLLFIINSGNCHS